MAEGSDGVPGGDDKAQKTRAIITLTDEPDGGLGVKLEFDPPLNDEGEITTAQGLGFFVTRKIIPDLLGEEGEEYDVEGSEDLPDQPRDAEDSPGANESAVDEQHD